MTMVVDLRTRRVEPRVKPCGDGAASLPILPPITHPPLYLILAELQPQPIARLQPSP